MEDEGAFEGIVEFSVEGEVHGSLVRQCRRKWPNRRRAHVRGQTCRCCRHNAFLRDSRLFEDVEHGVKWIDSVSGKVYTF
jgi:hypothetical protein